MSENAYFMLLAIFVGAASAILTTIVGSIFSFERDKLEKKKLRAELKKLDIETYLLLQPEPGNSSPDLPPGWFLGGNDHLNYRVGLDRKTRQTGTASAFIESISLPLGFVTIMQKFHPAMYWGKRLKMTGYVKTNKVLGKVALWMRVDKLTRRTVAFDNMMNRPITGTTGWQEYSIVLDVDVDAVNLSFGVLLAGEGKAWLNSIRFDIVGNDVPTTHMDHKSEAPINLDF